MRAMSTPPIGIVISGKKPITNPSATPSPTSFLYNIPTSSPVSHIVVFLLPHITLPPSSAAAVYLSLPTGDKTGSSFKLLGALLEGKESAIFQIKGMNSAMIEREATNGAEVDMDAETPLNAINLGISIESAEVVAGQLASQSQASNENPKALVLASPTPSSTSSTLVLARKIIKNAINFLASFDSDGSGSIPLKAFENWWNKFENRLSRDPEFLDKMED